jgi:hypothetical protein
MPLKGDGACDIPALRIEIYCDRQDVDVIGGTSELIVYGSSIAVGARAAERERRRLNASGEAALRESMSRSAGVGFVRISTLLYFSAVLVTKKSAGQSFSTHSDWSGAKRMKSCWIHTCPKRRAGATPLSVTSPKETCFSFSLDSANRASKNVALFSNRRLKLSFVYYPSGSPPEPGQRNPT